MLKKMISKCKNSSGKHAPQSNTGTIQDCSAQNTWASSESFKCYQPSYKLMDPIYHLVNEGAKVSHLI